jgi:hypothetical protein
MDVDVVMERCESMGTFLKFQSLRLEAASISWLLTWELSSQLSCTSFHPCRCCYSCTCGPCHRDVDSCDDLEINKG